MKDLGRSMNDHTPLELYNLAQKLNCERVAVRTTTRYYTYKVLDSRVNAFVCQLKKCFASFPEEGKVLVASKNSLGRIVSMLALLKLSIPYVPIDKDIPYKKLLDIQKSLGGLDCILCSDGYQASFPAGMKKKIYIIEDLMKAPVSNFEELQSENVQSSLSREMYIIFTSGTTGEPKGVKISHKAYSSHFMWFQKEFGFSRNDIWLHTIEACFDPSIDEIFVPLLSGGAVACLDSDDYDIQKNVFLLKATKSTFITCVPSTLKLFLQDSGVVECSSLRTIIVGGEKFDSQLVQKLKKTIPYVSVYNVYGPTETTISVSCYKVNDSESASIPIGYPSDNAEFFMRPQGYDDIRLPKKMAEGELCIAGDAVALGYLNSDAKTSKNFIPFTDPSTGLQKRGYLTGDLVRVDNEGLFHYLGRLDDQIKVNGIRVELGDISSTLLTHSAVSNCFTFLHGKKLISCVTLNHEYSSTITGENLRIYLRDQLREVLIPSDIFIVKDIPLKKSSGKVDQDNLLSIIKRVSNNKKKLLRTNFQGNKIWQILESIVNEILECLEIDNLDKDIPFSELGINSLGVQQLCLSLNNALGIRLNAVDVFEAVNLRGLYNYISSKMNSENPNLLVKHINLDIAKRSKKRGDISIIGISCQLGGGIENVEQFYNTLLRAKVSVNKLAKDKQVLPVNDNIKHASLGCYFEDSPYFFDHAYFGISLSEAKKMDPQHRLILQQVIHSLENAGIKPSSLHGKSVGVFIGLTGHDHAKLCGNNLKILDGLIGRGAVSAMASGRVNYYLGCTGPSIVFDTACSSSLTAVHYAKEALLNQECDLAIVASANVILTNDFSIDLARAGMLSRDGKCKAFSKKADGFARAEGAAAIVLKREGETVGHKIYANIISSSNNSDGKSNGITAPSMSSQVALMENCLKQCGVNAHDVSFIEAHGTGTLLGDQIETSAIKKVFYGRKCPVYMGSAKTNIGHTEAVAGLIGLIKATLSIHAQKMFAHPYASSESKTLGLSEIKAVLPREEIALKPVNKELGIVGMVNSYGVSGNNISILLSEPHYDGNSQSIDSFDKLQLDKSCILLLSAKTKEALGSYINSYINFFSQNKDILLSDICMAHNCSKEQFAQHRVSIIAKTHNEMVENLVSVKTKGGYR